METRPFAEFASLVHHDVVAQRAPFSITIEEIQQLTTKVRVGELGFVPNASAVHFVRECLGIA